MHREDNERMGLLSYIKGNRKGREAHNLEREAMQDPFLADALDGYSDMEGPELDVRLRRMEEKVEQRSLRNLHESAAAPVRAQYDMSHEAEYAMEMNKMQDVLAPTSIQRPLKGQRKNFFIWISAAACLLIVCALSYNIGVLRGKKEIDMLAQNSMGAADANTQTTAFDSAEAMEELPYRLDNTEPQIATAERKMRKIEPARENANESLCPTIGYKAYYEYIYKEMKESVSFDSDNISGIVVLSFDIDNSGRPSNIKITESSSDTIARKLIDILKKGECWSGHGKVESFVFIY